MPPRQRRSRVVEDESDEDLGQRNRHPNRVAEDSDREEQEDGELMEVESSAEDQLAKKLIRYAIACEFSRTVIRRDGIKERVLGNQGRAFRRVFDLAQRQLRTVWGMELRELPAREKFTAHEKRKALQSQSQTKVNSGTYVLSSTLPVEYRSATILAPSKAPSAETEASYAAFYTLVVSLIWLSGGELSDPSLRRYLKRMNAEQNIARQSTDDTLKRMERQGYVLRKVEKSMGTQAHDQVEDVIWFIGPRGREEIGIDGVAGLVREVYGGSDRDLEKKLSASLGIRQPEETEDGTPIEEEDAEPGASNVERRRTRGMAAIEED